jgi:hypothetical protein
VRVHPIRHKRAKEHVAFAYVPFPAPARRTVRAVKTGASQGSPGYFQSLTTSLTRIPLQVTKIVGTAIDSWLIIYRVLTR